MVALSDKVGPRLLEWLGLPTENIKSALIKVEAGKPVLVVLEAAPEDPKSDHPISKIRRFKITDLGATEKGPE